MRDFTLQPHFSSGLFEQVDGRKGKILIWFVQQGRMHLLLTKEALTIIVILTCLTKLILLRWSVQYAKAIGQ